MIDTNADEQTLVRLVKVIKALIKKGIITEEEINAETAKRNKFNGIV